MPAVRHCKHCWGDCDGTCLLPGDLESCIHKITPKWTFRERVILLGRRRFWRRVLWGLRA
jgi:hypothetical protein